MAKNTIADLDVTTGNNLDVLGQSAAGSADANQLDAVDRATLSLLARFYDDLGGVVTVGGSANAITVTSASTYQSLATGLVIAFKAASANTAAATLNLDSLGAKAIRLSGDVALTGGEIKANGRYLANYDAAYNGAAGAWVLTGIPEKATECIGISVVSESTTLTTGTAKRTFRMPFALTLTAVRASLSTASSSGTPTVDINEGGTTILSTKLTIDANELTSTTAATAAVISDTALADDAEITIDIDVAGTGAKGLKVYINGYRP